MLNTLSTLLLALVLAVATAHQAAPAPQPAPQQPAPQAAAPQPAAPAPQVKPAAPSPDDGRKPLGDPTRPDPALLQALRGGGRGTGKTANSPLSGLVLRALVVRADGTGAALVETERGTMRMTAGFETALDPAGLTHIRVVSLDAKGVVIEDVIRGDRATLD